MSNLSLSSVSSRFSFRLCLSFAALCVAALAGGRAFAATPEVDFSGRWQGSKSEFGLSKVCAESDQGCRTLTLDVSRCGEAWCGVEVIDGSTCGATALKMTAAATEGVADVLYKGTLSLAKSTEPYVVEVTMQVFAGSDAPEAPRLTIVGDTGGEFRMFRRTFPFYTAMSKVGPATCTPEKALSMFSDPSRRAG